MGRLGKKGFDEMKRYLVSIRNRVILAIKACRAIFTKPKFKNEEWEIKWSLQFTKDEFVPTGMPWDIKLGALSPYFEKYGFCVPLKYGELFSHWGGVVSDRYLSMDMYFF